MNQKPDLRPLRKVLSRLVSHLWSCLKCEGGYLKHHSLLLHTLLSTFGIHTNEEECGHDESM